MLRDKLGELSTSGDVEIVKKVPWLRPCSSHINYFHVQLITALDISAFREVGKAVNETVCCIPYRISGRPAYDFV